MRLVFTAASTTECYHTPRTNPGTTTDEHGLTQKEDSLGWKLEAGRWKLRAGRVTIQNMRLAWFSPMPPVPSGIAACSAELVGELRSRHHIDVYVDGAPGAAPPGANAAH